jgi:Phage minor structural protein GP20.
MKREFLEKLGLEKDVIDKILNENGRGLEAQKTKITELEEAKKTAESLVAERDSQIEKLSKSKGNAEDLQAEMKKLQEDNKAAAEKHAQEIMEIRRGNAIDAALAASKAKNVQATKALLDLSKITVADDGTIIGIDEQIKGLVEGEGTKFLFGEPEVSITGTRPTTTPNTAPASAAEQEMQQWRSEAGL